MGRRFDAATDRVSYGASAPPNPDVVTVSGVMWLTLSVDRDDFSTFLRLHSAGGGSTCFTFATGSGGVVPCIFTPGGFQIIGPAALAVGVPTAVGFRVSGAAATVVMRDPATGVVSQVTGAVDTGAAPDALTLGGRSAGDPSEWFNGEQAYVRLWAGSVSNDQMRREWFNPLAVLPGGLWSDWPLVDLADRSGQGRNLVAGSTATTLVPGPGIGPGRGLLDHV